MTVARKKSAARPRYRKGWRHKWSDDVWRAVDNLLAVDCWTAEEIAARFPEMRAHHVYQRKRELRLKEYRASRKYQSEEYRAWREACLRRDRYRCVVCERGRHNSRAVLQVDHIVAWSRSPELRFEVSNGRTLCIYHHRRTPNYGRRALSYDNNLETPEAWVRRERLLWEIRECEKQQKRKKKT